MSIRILLSFPRMDLDPILGPTPKVIVLVPATVVSSLDEKTEDKLTITGMRSAMEEEMIVMTLTEDLQKDRLVAETPDHEEPAVSKAA